MKLNLPITQRQNIEIDMRGDVTSITIVDTNERDRKQTAQLEKDQLADLIEMLQLCRDSRNRRKVK